MKKSFCAAAAASLLALPLPLIAADGFQTDKEKISYSIGVDMGRNLSKQGIDVDPDLLSAGIKDALSGGELKMSDSDMQSTMQSFLMTMQQKMMAKRQAEGADNQAKGEAFLEENKKKDGWKTTPSGLQYRVITTGTGEKPKATDTVVTQYRGTKIDGTEFDSSYKRNEPAEFPVNAVIPGWTEALQMMTVGSKWQLAIPAKLAYGERAPAEIGSNAVLLFDVELLGIKKNQGGSQPAPTPTGK